VTNEMPIVPNYFEQIQDLTSVEQQGVNAFLKSANEDSKKNVVQAVKNYRILMSNEYECPPIGVSKNFRIVSKFFFFFLSGNL
jgi:hypothetical protein